MNALRFGGLLLVLALLSAACRQLLGDFTVEESTGCTNGAAQCVGTVLQVCDTKRSVWANADVCASEKLCDSAAVLCLEPTCLAGARQCVGAELQGCNVTRDGWSMLATCRTAGHCSATNGTCTDQPCVAGTKQCNGSMRQECKADQSGWEDKEDCGSAALCGELACKQPICAADQYQCEAEKLQVCNATLDGWTQVQSCESAELCDWMNGTCLGVGCTTPGAHRCDASGVLERCSDNLTGWTVVESCPSAAQCDALNGSCTDMPCTPGVQRCNGAALEVCNTTSSGWDLLVECETDGLCQQTLALGATTCAARACDPGTFQCNGAQPQICNAALTEFRDNGDPCVTAELCNGASGTCGEPVCAVDATRCVDAQPEICNPGRTMFEPYGEPCANAALCDPVAGTCTECTSGQKRCNPKNPTQLQVCNASLSGWDDCDTCASPELCTVSLTSTTCGSTSCTEPTCNIQDRWCSGGNVLMGCPPSLINSQAVMLDTCATNGLCDATRMMPGSNSCIEPTCNLPDRWCGGSGNRTLYKCPESRMNSRPVTLDVCETAGLCAQAHADPMAMTCPDPVCSTGYSCGGTGSRELRSCNADRTVLTTCDTCDSSALCTDSLNATACNANSCHVCLAGEKNCSGNQLRVCNSAHTGWDTRTCGSATLCTNSLTPASQTTCDACIAGTFNCNGAQPQRCNDPGTGPAVWQNAGDPCADAASCDASTGTCTPIGSAGAGG